MVYERKQYLDQLIKKKDNGRVKVITGLRRSGKSYLLFNLFRNNLMETGVREDQIIALALDEIDNAKYRNPFELNQYVKEQIKDKTKRYYIFLDEIQFVSTVPNPYVDAPDAKLTFIDVVLGLMKIPNADVYITVSNSKMLSSDILTQFRDRGDEIKVYPLSYQEFYEHYDGDKRGAWRDYYTYGGMPLVWTYETHEERSRYLIDLFSRTYIKDVLERNKIKKDEEALEILLNVLASAVGSLTNPTKLSNTFDTERHISISPGTIDNYIGFFMNAYLIQKAERYDVKGRKYIKTPVKYYFSDPGLRNARLGFRQIEETHLMENVLYNDLIRRGYDVDVGVVEQHAVEPDGKKVRKQLEVDFVINRGDERCYIQSALSIDEPDKKAQEIASLIRIPDSFRKIVVVKDYMKPWRDENGIQYVGVEQFLLDEDFLSH
ncbi:ATP-binding protein [Spirochaetales bacterium NM-380-WT-3C1]|uniref:ATP-binding protein n=1 Tax=Bullifex porci TaxID=2606638 RepID=A0A7X2PE95_9SPIO|nr:ATP-binding protein [Bullifex porci]MSU07289.1 ATP-binding protein [Bullifex porci]